LIRYNAPDKYTIVFKSRRRIPIHHGNAANVSLAQCMENYDVVREYGDMPRLAPRRLAPGRSDQDFVPGKYARWKKIRILGT